MKIKTLLRDVFSMFARRKPQFSAASLERALNPPHDDTAELLHGEIVKDPFRPMEKLDAEEVKNWIARHNQRYKDHMAGTEEDVKRAMDFFSTARVKGMRETMPAKYGDKYIVRRKEESEPRFSVFVKDVPDYGAPARKLLDPLVIDPSGKTNINFTSMSPDGKTLAYALNVSGSDKGSLHLMDVESGRDLDIVYKDFQTNVNEHLQWDLDGKGFFYNQSDAATKSSTVRYHKMGTGVDADKTLYAPGAAEQGGEVRLVADEKGQPGAYEYISQYQAINVNETDKTGLFIRKRGSEEAFKEIFPMKEGLLTPIGEVNGRTLAWTNYKSPNGRLVSFDVNDPAPEKWQDVLPESDRSPLKEAFVWQGKIFATYAQEDTGQALKVFDLSGKFLHDAPIPPLSTFTMGQVSQSDPEAYITFSNFSENGGIYKYNADENKMTLVKSSTLPIDLKDTIVEIKQAKSKDGTMVPMTIIRGKDTKLDGTAATLQYGYGGFNIALEPAFSVGVAQWVRAGGIYVQTHLRGGGEFGQKWYDGGRLANKENVFDDNIAISEWLIENKYTSNKRLVIQGGSNGGLLTLATMLKAAKAGKKLYGAVISQVPVADLLRFHIGSFEGFSWKSDYGDPDKKEDFKWERKLSPVHNVDEGIEHPPLLVKTDINDDRVLPWHSLKFVATMLVKEAKNSLTFLQVKTDGGHSAGMTEQQAFEDSANTRAFITKHIGPLDQNEYKLWLEKQAQAKKGFDWTFGFGKKS